MVTKKIKPLSSSTYEKLRRIAAAYLRREAPGQTLAPTGLLHEAYLRWLEDKSSQPVVIPRLMKEILINRGIAKKRIKRGGKEQRVIYHEEFSAEPTSENFQIEKIAQALIELKSQSPRLAKLMELRLDRGMTIRESAKALGISEATVKRDWLFLKAWLQNELEKETIPQKKAS